MFLFNCHKFDFTKHNECFVYRFPADIDQTAFIYHTSTFFASDLIPLDDYGYDKFTGHYNDMTPILLPNIWFSSNEYRKIFTDWLTKYSNYYAKNNFNINNDTHFILPINTIKQVCLKRIVNMEREWYWIVENCNEAVYKVDDYWAFSNENDAAFAALKG